MYCINCGNSVDNGATNCVNCGISLINTYILPKQIDNVAQFDQEKIKERILKNKKLASGLAITLVTLLVLFVFFAVFAIVAIYKSGDKDLIAIFSSYFLAALVMSVFGVTYIFRSKVFKDLKENQLYFESMLVEKQPAQLNSSKPQNGFIENFILPSYSNSNSYSQPQNLQYRQALESKKQLDQE